MMKTVAKEYIKLKLCYLLYVSITEVKNFTINLSWIYDNKINEWIKLSVLEFYFVYTTLSNYVHLPS